MKGIIPGFEGLSALAAATLESQAAFAPGSLDRSSWFPQGDNSPRAEKRHMKRYIGSDSLNNFWRFWIVERIWQDNILTRTLKYPQSLDQPKPPDIFRSHFLERKGLSAVTLPKSRVMQLVKVCFWAEMFENVRKVVAFKCFLMWPTPAKQGRSWKLSKAEWNTSRWAGRGHILCLF